MRYDKATILLPIANSSAFYNLSDLYKFVIMETIQLNITREKSFVGVAMPYRIIINGEEVGKVRSGGTLSVEIPNVNSTLEVSVVGNAMTFHPVKAYENLVPQYCKKGIINCVIKTKANVLGVLTSGIFQAVGRLELYVNYI